MTDLSELAHELRAQDNAATAHPLFLVQQRRRIWGMDPDIDEIPFVWQWKEDWEYTYEPDEIIRQIRDDDEEGKLTHVADEDIDPEDHGYQKLAYAEHWDFVTAHFTRRAAERYIESNRHNLTDPRVYVSSQYRCPEWQAVVEHLKGIDDAE